MSIGGNSFNNGVCFLSDNYTAEFVMKNDNTYEISTDKRMEIGKIKDFISNIPLIKGLWSMFEGNKIMIILVLIGLVNDFFLKQNQNTQSSVYVVTLAGISIALLICIAYVVKKILYKVKATWMFHGAEHKTIYAYINDIELTLENVRKCPRIAKRCGTNLVVLILLFYIPLMFLIDYQSIRLILSWMLAYEIFDLKNGDTIPIIKLFFMVGYWCQQRLFTKEPSDIQLIASIETIQKLIGLEEEYSKYI